MLMIRVLIRITREPVDETVGLAVVVIFSVGGDWPVAGLADLAIRRRVPATRWGDIVTDENQADCSPGRRWRRLRRFGRRQVTIVNSLVLLWGETLDLVPGSDDGGVLVVALPLEGIVFGADV